MAPGFPLVFAVVDGVVVRAEDLEYEELLYLLRLTKLKQPMKLKFVMTQTQLSRHWNWCSSYR